MIAWDDAQYLKFADERTRAARELLARVPLETAERIVDLGCGPGNSTALLHHRWPAAHLLGVDNSSEMLARAKQDWPAFEWREADAGSFQANAPLDLLFANALLQWLPDHQTLLPRLFEQLRPGGVLALQVPNNFHEPSHRLMRELGEPWVASLAAVKPRSPVANPAFYYDLLAPYASLIDIWQTTYEHVLADPASIVDWVKGTGIRPYLAALPASEHAAYLAAYTHAIDHAYPARRDGKRLFSFPRLFIVATRAPQAGET